MTHDQKIATFNEFVAQHKYGAAAWWAASIGPEYEKLAHEAAAKWASRTRDSLTPEMKSEIRLLLR